MRSKVSEQPYSGYILHIRAVTTNTVYRAPTKIILVGAEGLTIRNLSGLESRQALWVKHPYTRQFFSTSYNAMCMLPWPLV